MKNFAATTNAATPIIKNKILKDSFIFASVAMQYVQKIIMKNKKQINCIAMNNRVSLIFNSMCTPFYTINKPIYHQLPYCESILVNYCFID